MKITTAIQNRLLKLSKKQGVKYSFALKQFKIGYHSELEHKEQFIQLGLSGVKLRNAISNVAITHLEESVNYYIELPKMERKLKIKEKFEHGAEVKTTDGKAGGLIGGQSHKNGGVKAVVVDDGRPVEIEAKEVIINKKSAQDPNPKHTFDNKLLTNKQILSIINQDGGGIPILEEGGVVKNRKILNNKTIFIKTILFDKSKYTLEEVKKWIKLNLDIHE